MLTVGFSEQKYLSISLSEFSLFVFRPDISGFLQCFIPLLGFADKNRDLSI